MKLFFELLIIQLGYEIMMTFVKRNVSDKLTYHKMLK